MRIARSPAPIKEQALRTLRQAIATGRFKPGQRLKERELCDLLGVSRTSIREALRQLEAEGIVQNIPNTGPVVATLTPQAAADIYQIRALLEGLAGQLFAERATPGSITALQRCLRSIEEAQQGDNFETLVAANNEFYEILLSGCGNAVLHEMLRTLRARISILRATTLSRPRRSAESLEELRRIVSAIENRDPQAAWSACVEHVEAAAPIAQSALQQSLEAE